MKSFGRYRERADRYRVDTTSSIGFQIRFRNPAARFHESVIPQTLSMVHVENGRDNMTPELQFLFMRTIITRLRASNG
jgi:hypothetical protein